MKNYIISKEDLILFAYELFESGYGGYLDIKELTCDSMIEKFLENRPTYKTQPSNFLQPTGIGTLYGNFFSSNQNLTLNANPNHPILLTNNSINNNATLNT